MDQTNTIQSVYIPENEEKIVYKNVRKPNLPATADIAYCEIRIAELQAELDASKETTFRLQQQLDLYITYEQSLVQYEEKISILTIENKGLNDSLLVKSRDLEQAQLKIIELEQQIECWSEQELELQKQISIATLQDRYIQDLKEKNNQLEQLLLQTKNWEIVNNDQKNQIINLKHDIELWKGRFNKAENEKQYLLQLREEDLKGNKLNIIENIDTQPQSPQVEHQEQVEPQPIQKQSNNFGQLQQQLSINLFEKEHQNQILTKEINDLRQQQIDSRKQLSDLASQLSKMDTKDREIERLNGLLQEKPRVQIVQEEKIVNVYPAEIDEEKTQLENLLDDYNAKLNKSQQENENIKLKVQTLENLNQQLQRDNRRIPRLQEQIELLTIDITNLRETLKIKENEQNSLLDQIKQYQIKEQDRLQLEVELKQTNISAQLSQEEINKLRKTIRNLENEIQNLKNIETQLAQEQNNNSQLSKQINEIKQQNLEFQNKINNYEIQINILNKKDQKLQSQQASIQALKLELQETLTESEQWRAKYNQNCSEIIRLQRLLEVSKDRIQKLNEENKNFNDQYKVPELKLETFQLQKLPDKIIVQDESKISILQNQLLYSDLKNESLLRNHQFEIQDSKRELNNLQSKFDQQRKESETWKTKYLASEQQNTKLESINDKYLQLKLKFDSQKAIIKGLEQKSTTQLQEIEDLRTQIFTQNIQLNQIENLKTEKEQQKEKTLLLYSELQESQQKVAKLFGSVNELQRQLALKSNTQTIQSQNTVGNSEGVEKLRQKIVDLELQIDDTKDDQIEELKSTISSLEKQLSAQIDLNQQIVKELQNVDRKRQSAISELEALQSSETDTNQLRIAYNKKSRELDQMKMDCDKFYYSIQELEQQIGKLKDQENNQQNNMLVLKKHNNNLQKQIASLLLHLNSLELTNNSQRHQLEGIPELQSRIIEYLNKIQEQEQQLKDLGYEKDTLSIKVSDLQLKISELLPLQQLIDQLKETIEKNQRDLSLWKTKFEDLENERSQQNEEWRRKVDQFQIELKNQQELQNFIKQLQNDVENLINNNDKLSNQNRTLSVDLWKAQSEIENKEIEIKRLQAIETDFRSLQESHTQEIQKCQNLSDQLFLLQNQYDQTKREQEKLENKCAMMSSEIERLKVMQKNKNQQLEEIKSQIHNYEQQIDQLTPLQLETRRLNDELQKLMNLNDDLKHQIMGLQKLLDEKKRQFDLEQQNNQQLDNQIDQLLQALRAKEDDIHQLRSVNRSFEIQIQDTKKDQDQWNEQQNEINKLSQQINYLNELLDQKIVENENLSKQNLQQQSQILENQKLDFSLLEKTVEAREKEVEEWRRRFQKMQQDQEKLYTEKLDLNNKIASMELEIERQKRKVTSTQGELHLQQNIIDQLNVEIERLNQSSIDLLQDNSDWREKYVKIQQQVPTMLEVLPPITPGSSFRVQNDQSQQ